MVARYIKQEGKVYRDLRQRHNYGVNHRYWSATLRWMYPSGHFSIGVKRRMALETSGKVKEDISISMKLTYYVGSTLGIISTFIILSYG